MYHTMHLQPSVAKQPNLKLKTRPKQLLGSLLLVIALPESTQHQMVDGLSPASTEIEKMAKKYW